MAWYEKRGDRFLGRYRDANGRRRSAPGGTFPTPEQAVAAAQLQEEKIGRGLWLDPDAGERTLSEYFDRRWIAARRLEPNGRLAYKANFNAGIRPVFGHLPLRRITQAKVQTWIEDMEREGKLKPGTIVQGRYGTLHAILAAKRGPSAKNDNLITVDPCAGVVLPHVPEREVNIYTPDQVDALVEALDPWWRLLVWLDSEIGARWGELMALRPCDIDLEAHIVTIRRTIAQVGCEETKNGTPFMVKPWPKGKKERLVGISDETCDMLRFHIKGRNLKSTDHLFTMPVYERGEGAKDVLVPEVLRTDVWSCGYPIDRKFFHTVWRKAVHEAGIPMRRRHDLRASFISWLCADPNLTQLQVMEMVGHENWATTKRYAKTLNGTQKAGVAAIQGMRAKYRANARQQEGEASSGDAAATG